MLGIGKGYVNWRRLCRLPFSYRQKNVSLTTETTFPYIFNYSFGISSSFRYFGTFR